LRRIAKVGQQQMRALRSSTPPKVVATEQRRQMYRRCVRGGVVQEPSRLCVEVEEARTVRDATEPEAGTTRVWEGNVNPHAKQHVKRTIERHRLNRALSELTVGGEWFQLAELEGDDQRWGRMVHRLARKAREWAVRAAARQLPDARNLRNWGGKQCKCICGQAGIDRHVLSNCPKMLERYTWRHDCVLRVLVDALRAWGQPGGWEIASDLPGADTKTQALLRAEGVLTDRRVDILAVRRDAHGAIQRAFAIELSIVWEGMTTRYSSADDWAKRAAAAGKTWTNTMERRAAAKRLKYERDVLESFPPEWRTGVVTVEVGARGVLTAGVVKQLTRLGREFLQGPSRGQKGRAKKGKRTPGPTARARELACALAERAVLGSFVLWQKRQQEWDVEYEDGSGELPTQPMVDRSLHVIDAARQKTERRREEDAGALKPAFVDAARLEDDADAAVNSDFTNTAWQTALAATTQHVEADPAAVRVYTDGSYKDGHAGWGWVAVTGGPGQERRLMERSGPVVKYEDPRWVGCQFASNNAGELSAVIDALGWLSDRPTGERRVIVADSLWAIGVARGGRAKFHRNAARRAQASATSVAVEFGWVEGHTEHTWNERADTLANGGREIAVREGRDKQQPLPRVAKCVQGGAERGAPPCSPCLSGPGARGASPVFPGPETWNARVPVLSGDPCGSRHAPRGAGGLPSCAPGFSGGAWGGQSGL